MEKSDQDWTEGTTNYDGSIAKRRSKRAVTKKHSISQYAVHATGSSSTPRNRATGASRKRSSSKKHSFSRVTPTKAASSKAVTFSKHHVSALDDPCSLPTSKGSTSASSTLGLRNMSVKICEKVQSRGKVTCNELADELLQIVQTEQGSQGDDRVCDDKNLRRRLYDALNVLEAVDVIEKENKDITWKGMPDGHDDSELQRLVAEHDKSINGIHQKEDELREKLVQYIANRNLVRSNKQRAALGLSAKKVAFPFVVLNAHPYAEVQCDASCDLTDLMIDVNAPFALHDDNSVLRHMGFDQTTTFDLEELIPNDMLDFSMKQGLLRGIVQQEAASRKRCCKIALPTESWAQPRPNKRFKAAQQGHY
ncbi:Transcription factor Dp-1 [Seminavis robusta]|uniref:Transcription factor Dp-1 n=1 Tax=Seminavis robusta TaxID=568900 RepID=A0A9N8HU05_9STRA|nr:Transcription factor Dp-1 [Seminavis robusta]|eukprot:Sro1737_g294460.1 Transcription factor Dp-1 (365) ;mRNA; r:12743-13946